MLGLPSTCISLNADPEQQSGATREGNNQTTVQCIMTDMTTTTPITQPAPPIPEIPPYGPVRASTVGYQNTVQVRRPGQVQIPYGNPQGDMTTVSLAGNSSVYASSSFYLLRRPWGSIFYAFLPASAPLGQQLLFIFTCSGAHGAASSMHFYL